MPMGAATPICDLVNEPRWLPVVCFCMVTKGKETEYGC